MLFSSQRHGRVCDHSHDLRGGRGQDLSGGQEFANVTTTTDKITHLIVIGKSMGSGYDKRLYIGLSILLVILLQQPLLL